MKCNAYVVMAGASQLNYCNAYSSLHEILEHGLKVIVG